MASLLIGVDGGLLAAGVGRALLPSIEAGRIAMVAEDPGDSKLLGKMGCRSCGFSRAILNPS